MDWFVFQPARIERRTSGQQHVKHHTQRVDVGASVHILSDGVTLLRAHVTGGSHKCPNPGLKRGTADARVDCLCQSKVDDPGDRLAVHLCNQDICRLQVTMDDCLLVRMLHRFANGDEKPKSVADFEPLLVTIVSDWNTGHVFHHEIRLPLRCGACVKNLGDRRVVHDRECLPLSLKALKKRIVVRSPPNQFDGDLPLKWNSLLGEPDLAHTPFADFFPQAIWPNRTNLSLLCGWNVPGTVRQRADGIMRLEQGLYFLP